MKHLLNTLFLTRDDLQLVKDGQSLLVKQGNDVLLRKPVHMLGGVISLGRSYITPQAMAFCAENDVALSLLSPNGRFLAQVRGPVSGNVLLRRAQFRLADDDKAANNIAQAVVAAKLVNCRGLLRRAARDQTLEADAEALALAADRLAQVLRRLEGAQSLEETRGLEGEGAAAYFGVFGRLISAQGDGFVFNGRNRRPPRDAVNALLSFAYTLLAHDISGACQAVGLDPQVGFLHRDRPGRPSLALDLMEEMRPIMVDRLVLNLINLRQVRAKGFAIEPAGGVRMDDDTRKNLLVAYQERKQKEIHHPVLDEKIPLGLLPHVQAMLLARHIRGDLPGYPAHFHKF